MSQRHHLRYKARPLWKPLRNPTEKRAYILHPDVPPLHLTDEDAAVVRDIFAEIAADAFRAAALFTPGQILPPITKETV